MNQEKDAKNAWAKIASELKSDLAAAQAELSKYRAKGYPQMSKALDAAQARIKTLEDQLSRHGECRELEARDKARIKELEGSDYCCKACGGTKGHWEGCKGESELEIKIQSLESKLSLAKDALERWGKAFKGIPHCGCGVDDPKDICMIHEAVEEALAKISVEK